MSKTSLGSPQGASTALVVTGVVLIAAFFAPWIDVGGELELSGWWLADHEFTRLFLVPALGAAIVLAGVTRSRYLPLVGAIAALAIVGTTAYYTVRSVFHLELGALLALVGGAVALAGISPQRRGLRALGGAVALAGFFMAWAGDASGYEIVRADDPALDALGLNFAPVWAVPAGALLAIAGVFGKRGGALAGLGGAAILGGLLWFLGSLVNLVAGWGAWVTLGAGVVAGATSLVAARSK